MGERSPAELSEFHASWLAAGMVIHVIMSLGVGALYGVLLARPPPIPGSLAWGGLLFADAPSGDFGPVVILAFDGAACHAPQHGDLADMSERIGNWALE